MIACLRAAIVLALACCIHNTLALWHDVGFRAGGANGSRH